MLGLTLVERGLESPILLFRGINEAAGFGCAIGSGDRSIRLVNLW
ncbi:MAG: hypothetical protein JWP27_198, partial [Flaviaesturariibacter sp.]|nr:hypothetical protein [Flaviaesturariibacter sp.]